MFKTTFWILFSWLFITACQPYTHLVKAENVYKQLNASADVDSSISNLINPYKVQIESKMNSVIGQAAKALTKDQPESTLGNWITDLMHQKGEEFLKQKIDFAVLNYGGLRVPYLPKGDITIGHIFELMPFDNLITIVEIKGSDLMDLFHLMVKNGGWPLSKQVKIVGQGKKAIDVLIHGQKIDPERLYSFVTNDYMADGGDNCWFLKDKKHISTGILLRNAMVEFVQEETKAGRQLDATLTERLFILK